MKIIKIIVLLFYTITLNATTLSIKNNSSKTITKILEYDNTLTTDIEFYKQLNGKYHQTKEGILHLDKNRTTIKPIFKITLNPNETKIYYIKATSYITTLIVKLNLWEELSFEKKENKYQIILAMFFGAMLILAIYNFSIYFFTKDKSYLFYTLYMVGIIIHQLAYTGVAQVYLLDKIWGGYLIEYAVLLIALPVFAISLLTRSFLRTSQYPIWNKILNIFLSLYPFFIIIFLVTDEFNKYRNTFPVLLVLFLTTLTIYATYKRNRQAYFVFIGWSIFFTAAFFMYLSSIGVFSIYEIFPYYAEVALVLEAIIFSIALADKIKQLQIEKNEANMALILEQQIQTQRLENQVAKKTESLKTALTEKEILLKELNHRVKNNMQTIVSLIRLQRNDIQNNDVKEMFTTIQNRINSMSTLHELLYTQDDISYVDANSYFSILIEQMNESYLKDIEVNYDISTTLKAEQAVYCGLIVNELITNSFKYAFKNNDKINSKNKIDIKLYKDEDIYILTISDNGIGYDLNLRESTKTLGLILVNTLATKQLKGSIDIETNDGVNTTIKWN